MSSCKDKERRGGTDVHVRRQTLPCVLLDDVQARRRHRALGRAGDRLPDLQCTMAFCIKSARPMYSRIELYAYVVVMTMSRRKHERSRSPRRVRESSGSPRRSHDRKGETRHRRSKSRSKSRDKRRKRSVSVSSSSSSSGSESDSSDESSSGDDRKRSRKRSSSSKKKHAKKSSDSKKKKKKKKKDSHKKKARKKKSRSKRHDSDSDSSDSGSDTVRSAISGKKIKRKLSRTATDLQHQKNRQQLLQFYNGMYD